MHEMVHTYNLIVTDKYDRFLPEGADTLPPDLSTHSQRLLNLETFSLVYGKLLQIS